MAEQLGSLVVGLSIDTAEFHASTGRAAYIAEKSFKDIAATAAKYGTHIGAAALAAAAAIEELTRATLNAADAQLKMSQKAGVSVESFGELAYAAKLADVDAEALTGSLGKLSKSMAEAASGSAEAKEGFDLLGVSFKDGSGQLRATDDVLIDVAEKFAGMKDGAEKTALAMRLFGKSGADLIPFLNQGKDGIQQLSAEANRLGVTFTTDLARQAEAINDNFTKLKEASVGAARALINPLIPAMKEITDRMVDATTSGGKFAGILAGIREGLIAAFGDTSAQKLAKINKQIEDSTAKIVSLEAQSAQRPYLTGFADQERARVQLLLAERAKLEGLVQVDTPGAMFQTEQPKADAPKLRDRAAEARAAADRQKALQDYIKGVQRAQAANEEFAKEQGEINRYTVDQILERERVEAEAYAARKKSEDDQFQREIAMIYNMGEVGKAVEETNNIARDLGLTFSSAFEDAILKGSSFRDVLQGIAADIARIILRRGITEPFAQGVSDFAKSSGVTDFLGSALGSLFGGGKAAGGPVTPGKAYTVGEFGRETFVPDVAGQIIPAGGSAGGIVYSPTVNIDSRTDQAQVAALVQGALAQDRQRLMQDFRSNGPMRRAIGGR